MHGLMRWLLLGLFQMAGGLAVMWMSWKAWGLIGMPRLQGIAISLVAIGLLVCVLVVYRMTRLFLNRHSQGDWRFE